MPVEQLREMMAEEKARQYLQTRGEKDGQAYSKNFQAHRPGIDARECISVYDEWTTYEQDLGPERYRGPVIAAEAVGQFFPSPEQRREALVLDVACGTGFVAQELRKLGFERLNGLDPSISQLEMARKKHLYSKDFQCYLDSSRLPIDDDTYDCAVTAGGMGEGHIPTAGLYELVRIVKPGGLVCIVMREEYLEHVQEYRGKLEATMKDMEGAQLWRQISRVVVPRYSFENNGVVFKFVVC